jgi:hypothetical protein
MRKLIISITILAFAAVLAFGQEKTDFSGVWKLNVSDTEFGVMSAQKMRVDIIKQNGFVIDVITKFTTDAGDEELTRRFKTNGEESVNQQGPRDVKSVATWEGNSLVFTNKYRYQDQEVLAKTTWTLSPNHKKLFVNTHTIHPAIGPDQKLVFDRQN